MSGLAEFFMGFAGGAAQAGVDSIIEKEKAAIAAARDEQLSKLRMKEHAANRDSDAKAKDDAAARERARLADVDRQIKADAPSSRMENAKTTYRQGDEIDAGEAEAPPQVKVEATSRERNQHGYKKSMALGEMGLAEHYSKQEGEDRKDEAEQRKDRIAADANTTRNRELTQREKRDSEKTELETRRINVLIAKVAGGGASGKETAEIQNLRFYADNVFGGVKIKDKDSDEYRAAMTDAAMWLRNHGDKPRDQRVTEIANQLKDDTDYMGLSYEERLAKAGQIADRLRAQNPSTRGGVSPKAAPSTGPAVVPKKDRPPLNSFERK